MFLTDPLDDLVFSGQRLGTEICEYQLRFNRNHAFLLRVCDIYRTRLAVDELGYVGTIPL